MGVCVRECVRAWLLNGAIWPVLDLTHNEFMSYSVDESLSEAS